MGPDLDMTPEMQVLRAIGQEPLDGEDAAQARARARIEHRIVGARPEASVGSAPHVMPETGGGRPRWKARNRFALAAAMILLVVLAGAAAYRIADAPMSLDVAGSGQPTIGGSTPSSRGSADTVPLPPRAVTVVPSSPITMTSVPVGSGSPLEHHPFGLYFEEARISGVLAVSADGCSEIGGTRAAWPADTTIEPNGGSVRLSDGRTFAIGSEIVTGGGRHKATELTQPDRCAGDDVVFVG